MRCAILLALLLGAGCTHVQVSGSSNTGASSVTSGAAGVQVQGSGALAAVVVAGMIVSAAMLGPPAPQLDPDRSVSEQDCTKPIALDGKMRGNLRCR